MNRFISHVLDAGGLATASRRAVRADGTDARIVIMPSNGIPVNHRMLALCCVRGGFMGEPSSGKNFAQKYLPHRSLYCIVGCRRLSFLFRWCQVCAGEVIVPQAGHWRRCSSAIRVQNVRDVVLDEPDTTVVASMADLPEARLLFLNRSILANEVMYGDSDQERTH